MRSKACNTPVADRLAGACLRRLNGADHYALLRSYSHRSLGGAGEEPDSVAAAASQRQHSALLADGAGVQQGQLPEQQEPAAAEPQDEWCYKDPQGVVQGPFARTDIIEW